MKKILILFIGVLIFGCGDVSELNDNPKGAGEVSANALFANANVALFDQMVSTNVNRNPLKLWCQYWTQTTYTDESNFELVNRDINGNFYNVLYAQVLKDLDQASTQIEASTTSTAYTDENKKNDLAIIEVLNVYAFHILVDVFGDVPYSQALSASLTPEYDDASQIYNNLFDRLDNAISQLGGVAGFGSSDLVYGGDADLWKRFANSLKLRMAVRLTDHDPSKAASAASEAVASGVMEGAAHDFELAYTSSKPNTNPLWEDLVESGRNDFVVSSSVGDIMNATNDPRRSAYAKNLGTLDSIVGGVPGRNNSFAGSSQIGLLFEDPTFPGTIMNYTEVLFNMAHAAQEGWISGSASDYYEQALMNSCVADWDVSEADAMAFVAANPYDAANWKESIGTQRYVALYNQGFEGWSTYRLYDFPTLQVAAEAATYPPFRFTYPVDEYSLNETSVTAAGAKLPGGVDDVMVKIFWDKN